MELNHAKVYAVLVLFAKRFFVFALSLFVALLMGWPFLQSFFSKTGAGERSTTLSILENTMEAPHFISQTDKGEPYEVWATRAQNSLSEQISLINPEGRVTKSGGGWVTLKAQQGYFREKEGLLTLERRVALQDVLGYQLETDRATVDLKAKRVEGPHPVKVSGPAGTAAADSFSFQEEKQGSVLVLKGHARLVIYPYPSTVK
jgi:hypothetical protein